LPFEKKPINFTKKNREVKFFLVISIIAFWWVPMNSPGNIGIPKTIPTLALSKSETSKSNNIEERQYITKRKMDHFGFQFRKSLINQ
jgi:hypothetical protein